MLDFVSVQWLLPSHSLMFPPSRQTRPGKGELKVITIRHHKIVLRGVAHIKLVFWIAFLWKLRNCVRIFLNGWNCFYLYSLFYHADWDCFNWDEGWMFCPRFWAAWGAGWPGVRLGQAPASAHHTQADCWHRGPDTFCRQNTGRDTGLRMVTVSLHSSLWCWTRVMWWCCVMCGRCESVVHAKVKRGIVLTMHRNKVQTPLFNW